MPLHKQGELVERGDKREEKKKQSGEKGKQRRGRRAASLGEQVKVILT